MPKPADTVLQRTRTINSIAFPLHDSLPLLKGKTLLCMDVRSNNKRDDHTDKARNYLR